MIKSLLRRLSPSGTGARLSILIFHRVLPQPDPLFPEELDAARFDALCGWLRTWFNVLPLDEAVHRLQQCDLPERALAISFDDGYADNHDVALPILLRHGLTATFFIATSFLNGGRMWNDTVIESVRRAAVAELDLRGVRGLDFNLGSITSSVEKRTAIARLVAATKYMAVAERQAAVDLIAARAEAPLPDNLMMSSAQIRALRATGMLIGAHTESHPILARLDRDAARREIETGKQTLEALIREPVVLFAYPNGKPIEDYSDTSVALVREAGFRAAVSTAPGAAGHRSDLFQLPRFTPWDRTRVKFGVRLALNLLNQPI